ncbi:tRNA pseudouridine synthase A [Pontibacillus yanchengensis Y32]|uniref:tRNA pseudouridine synthase A n=2 Tax=Pontibacillus yanchengensis TaxID=462910 RepID=A0A0A2T593_9BACI|nr:tRNA pseudouridine(38-40) synthase TruA [Pontibacillus yanchengensis]KGP70942.1 tRNA pseudouridine synthase A [Pontibacillus yanchengensis Y32]
MERICCTIQYDGTNYSGYQIQTNGRTVQEQIEKALTKMHKGTPIRIIASGRTDAGVHAMGQVVHFDSSIIIEEHQWKKALQTLLPADIYISHVEKVASDFHAQHQTTGKEYRYYVFNGKEPDIFKRHIRYHVPYNLDMKAIKKACTYIEGTHDFTSFCSMKTHLKGDKVRTITYASCEKIENEIIFTFRGDGFLYNMVRILVGTLLDIGQGNNPPEIIEEMIDAKDRRRAGKTAPPQGLFLWKVDYN